VSVLKVLEDCHVVLMDSPALMFSAEAERLAAEADMTLVVVQAGKNTRAELLRGARLLERLNVPAIGIILEDVQVKRAGRALRRDLREYRAMLEHRNGYRQLDGKALV
jgi:Mrp family chromosome partitioning ATPase